MKYNFKIITTSINSEVIVYNKISSNEAAKKLAQLMCHSLSPIIHYDTGRWEVKLFNPETQETIIYDYNPEYFNHLTLIVNNP